MASINAALGGQLYTTSIALTISRRIYMAANNIALSRQRYNTRITSSICRGIYRAGINDAWCRQPYKTTTAVATRSVDRPGYCNVSW
jgi:hypothetical protein